VSDGLSESLIYRSFSIGDLRVSPTSSVFRYKDKEIDPNKVRESWDSVLSAS